MPAARTRLSALAALSALALLAGCGKGASTAEQQAGGPAHKVAPVVAQGAVSVATRNTTRLGGAVVAADAASVARTVYPGLTPATRPLMVVVADESNWPAALAASVFASAPVSAPILYSEGGTLPEVSSQTLHALNPVGDPAFGGAQVLRLGSSIQVPSGYVTRTIPVSAPAPTSALIASAYTGAVGAPRQVIVVPANAPAALLMPAAGLSAESGAPIMFVTPARVPDTTALALHALRHPHIYVIDAGDVGPAALHELRHLGSVSVVSAGRPGEVDPAVTGSIAVSRYTDGTFGWGVKEPGHGLVFANSDRPLDAPAAALLSATGNYGPLLLLESPDVIAPALASYLADIQPAYTSAPEYRPVRGVYNHGWLIGDESAITATTQAELDSLLEISPRKQSSEEQPVAQAE
jgi:hypothetical protein